jgi:hypothetical protein
VFLGDIGDIIKDICHLSQYKVKYKPINKECILDLNILVFKSKRGVVYKRIKVFKLNYKL